MRIAPVIAAVLWLPVVEARPANTLPTQPDAQAALLAAAPGPWRASVADVARYELTPGRRTFSPGPAPPPFDVVVVAADPERVWVTDDYADVRLLIGVPRDRLAPRLIEPTALAATAEAAEAGSTVAATLAPGIGAVVVERRADAVHLQWTDDAVSVAGWVTARRLGDVWRYAPLDPGSTDRVRVDPSQPLPIYGTPDGACSRR